MGTVDAMRIKSSLLSSLNDAIEVENVPGGVLVTTPFSYSDGDRIELLVSQDGPSVRVSDRGSTDMVLELAGVDLEKAHTREVMRAAIARLFPFGMDGVAIESSTTEADLGVSIVDVVEAVIRTEGVRFLPAKRGKAKFSTRVTDHLAAEISRIGASASVSKNYRLSTMGGRERSVTAAVLLDDRRPMVVQAVNMMGEASEQSIATCYYAFDAAEPEAYSERVAVLTGERETVDEGVVRELESVSERVVFEGDSSFDKAIAEYVAPVLR